MRGGEIMCKTIPTVSNMPHPVLSAWRKKRVRDTDLVINVIKSLKHVICIITHHFFDIQWMYTPEN